MKVRPSLLLTAGISVLAPCTASSEDQQHTHGVNPTEVYLARQISANKAVRITQLDIEPHGIVDRHCHSGDEIGIVTKGTLMLRVGAGEYEPKRQGESFKVAANVQMTVKNDTDQAAQLYSVLVVDDDGKWLKHEGNDCAKD